MVQPVLAPYVPSYAAFTPYITADEFKQSATGVDVSQLVPGGTVEDNAAALVTKISRASNYADNICHQVLAATADVEPGRYRVYPDCTIRVPVRYSPLIAITAVSLGRQPGQLQPLTDLSGLWPERKVVEIPVSGYPAGSMVYTLLSYVNGWANTTLAAAAGGGAVSLTVVQPIGILPGLTMQLYDAGNTEPVTVAADYEYGSATVPLTTPTVFAHGGGTALSALPPVIKEAVVLLTTALIKTRGAESVAMGAMQAEPDKTEKTEPGGLEEFKLAAAMLTDFMRRS